jgi:hypothetical protein
MLRPTMARRRLLAPEALRDFATRQAYGFGAMKLTHAGTGVVVPAILMDEVSWRQKNENKTKNKIIGRNRCL